MPESKARVKPLDIKVKTMPYSLRKFIGEVMSDEAKFNAFAESPITALVDANVPINARAFTKADAEHLVLVLGKIHSYVKAKKFSKDVTFEAVFNVVAAGGVVAYVSPESSTYTWQNITPDTVTRTRTHRGISHNFYRDGLTLEHIGDIFTSPLISPAEFSTMISPMEKEIDAALEVQR